MMPYGWHDGGWGVLWMILSLGALVAIVWAVFRASTSEERRARPRDPEDLLAERFANGEIGPEDYQERLRILDERRSRTPGS
jgi:uncharacterized membrane protein